MSNKGLTTIERVEGGESTNLMSDVSAVFQLVGRYMCTSLYKHPCELDTDAW